MDFGVLGPLIVADDRSTALVLGSAKVRLLLAALLCRPNLAVSVDVLVDTLWGSDPPRSAGTAVRVYVHQLRRVVGDERVRHVAAGYQLVVHAGELDRDRFRGLCEQARQVASDGDPAKAGELFRQALQLWRGPAFVEFRDIEAVRAAAVELDESRLDVLEECFAAELAAGRHAEVCAELRTFAAEYPLREHLRELLMLALVRSGRQAEATAVFDETRRLLADEYGLDPGPGLVRLHQRILVRDPALSLRPTAAVTAPAGGTLHQQVTPSQLPGDIADFSGRAELLLALDVRAGSTGAAVAVTVVAGMAGVGKTALAVRWAHRVADRFPDGQLFVNLRGFGPGTPVQPLDALAGLLRGLGVAPEAVPLEVGEASALYRSVLAGRRVLVLLDNAGSAEQVRPLLPGDGGCAVVVTSRHRLPGLAVHEGAYRLNVDVLGPDEARMLLTALLGADRVAGQEQTVDELARLCAYLPLALRIVAAQLVDAPFRGVAEQVALLRAAGLHGMTVDGDDDAAVRAAFDASYESMPAAAQRMFRLLGLVPAGDVSVEAAGALAGVPVDEATRLLDRLTAGCLLSQPSAGRYTLHDLLRWYAAERVTADPEAADALHRFCDWYLHSVDAAARLLYPHAMRLPLPPGPPPPGAMRFDAGPAALVWIEAERANLVALIVYCAEHGPRPTAWLLADALRGVFGRLRHVVDWHTAVDAGLAAARRENDPRAVVAMLNGAAHASYTVCRYSTAVTYLSEAADLARHADWELAEVTVLGNLGIIQNELGQMASAARTSKRSLRLAERLASPDSIVNRTSNLSYTHWRMGRLQKAVRGGQWALELARRAQNVSCQASTHHILGRAYWDLGIPVRAAEHLQSALQMARETGSREPEIMVNMGIALIEAFHEHRPADALIRAKTWLDQAREIADRRVEAEAINVVAAIHRHRREYHEARRQYELGLSTATTIGTRQHVVEAQLGLATVHRRLGHLDPAHDLATQALGEATTRFMAVHAAQGNAILAEIELDRGNHPTAAAHARRALRHSRRTGHRPGEAHALAILAVATPHPEPARRFRTMAENLYAATGLTPDDRLSSIDV
jgi:DNA-binding SARP family transcriptional activator/tetratricopeptide (TPR) repeat protein